MHINEQKRLEGLNPFDFEAETFAFARQRSGFQRRDFLRLAMGAAAASLVPSMGTSSAAYAAGDADTLRIARVQDSITLDPQKTFTLQDHEVMWQIYDTLIYLDEAGHVFPGLAESWAFSDGNKSVTFKLRPGVEFHDGTPFNAEAVVETFNRHVAPETASPNAFLLGPLVRVEAMDPLTVVYHYSVPFVPLWVGIGYSYCAPISPAAIKKFGAQFGHNPVGTGPFKFESWSPDQGIRLVRNDKHNWATSMYANPGSPKLRTAEYVVIPEDSTRIAALQTGDVDMVAGDNAVPYDRVRELAHGDDIAITMRPAPSVFGLIFNQSKAPFNNLKLRQAVNCGVDKAKLIALVMDGNAIAASSPVSSAFREYDPETQKTYSFDPDRAKRLLIEGGKPDGFEFDFMIIDNPVFRRVAEVIQADLAKLSIKMNVVSLQLAELFAKAKTKTVDSVGLYYTYSDSDIIMPFLSKDGAVNYSFAPDNPELYAAMDQQRLEFDPSKRKALFHKIQKTLVDDAYWAPLYEQKYLVAATKKVKGISIDSLGFIHLQELSKA